MSVDEGNSIYVGSLPYSATENTIRRVFGPYGAIVSVKIINDQGKSGKCYCFVTFRNPRSAIDAITDMNGKTIEGRVIRVNGVTNREGRPNFSRERSWRSTDRGLHLDHRSRSRSRDRERDYEMDWDYRGRDRGRDFDRDRGRHRDQYDDRSRERNQPWDHDEDGERRRELPVIHDRPRDRDQSHDRVMVEDEFGKGRNVDCNWESGRSLHSDQEWGTERISGDSKLVDKEVDHQSRRQNEYNDQHSREISSDSSADSNDEVEEKLERSIERRDELKKEIFQLEKRLEDKQLYVSNLRKKAQILEDALDKAQEHSSQHKMQLITMHKCFLQVKDYSARLKSCEQELQSLVDSALTKNYIPDDAGINCGVPINSNA
ncbi:zinc finger CCCH domain-containing protein 25 [Mercurialis annua]|uniref:zinc finger CCCH domain-containing protein 25 n=1 Tax=Mercurialis annua TaxID=3986 RepID=UPI002160F6FB|nr:zinc finger CCCH domain-containing protein 25 [Mercurialis annua]